MIKSLRMKKLAVLILNIDFHILYLSFGLSFYFNHPEVAKGFFFVIMILGSVFQWLMNQYIIQEISRRNPKGSQLLDFWFTTTNYLTYYSLASVLVWLKIMPLLIK